MFVITFKDVGQGDSIIIEWKDNGIEKVGIIDCHKKESRNPVLEFLRVKVPKKIEFIILSHAHYDHFSGLSDVLDYCFNKKIIIENFYHTLSGQIVKIYSSENSTIKALAAEQLVENLKKYTKSPNQIINKKLRIDCERPIFKLSEKINLAFLSPNDDDYCDLEKAIGRYLGDKITTKPNLNHASTILKISNEKEYILLTADSTIPKIRRIEKLLKNDSLILAQVPHHGSKYNHRSKFWENVKRDPSCIALFSCGDEPADKIPHRQTVEEIHKLGFKIHSTNQVYGICDVFGELKSNSLDEEISSSLIDLFAESDAHMDLNIENELNGDQRFEFWS